MSALRTAAQQALTEMANARDYIWLLDEGGTGVSEEEILDKIANAITALRAALAEPVPPAEAQTESEKVAYCAGWWAALETVRTEPVQGPQCNPHPKAPHSFMRNASHTEDRYVCECEGWEPYEAGYQAGMEAALRAQS